MIRAGEQRAEEFVSGQTNRIIPAAFQEKMHETCLERNNFEYKYYAVNNIKKDLQNP